MNEETLNIIQNLRNKTNKVLYDSYKNSLTKIDCENIEKSIYNYCIRYFNQNKNNICFSESLFVHVYALKLFNLKKVFDDSDSCILKKIASKEIFAKDYAMLDENKNDIEEENIEEGIFQCKKCGSKKTTYYSLQTRSADEPMTNFITCVICKNRWKM